MCKSALKKAAELEPREGQQKRGFFAFFRRREVSAESRQSKPTNGRTLNAWRRLLHLFPQRKKAQSCPELQSHHDATEISMPSSATVVDDAPLLSLEDLPPLQTSPREALE